MERTLAIRIPLKSGDPFDIIDEIDRNHINLVELVRDRFESVQLNVETGDSILH